jgi:histidinol-phosphate aminotransferase
MNVQRLIRPLVRELHPYVPGEQPKIRGLIKLNTNENPYPPSPKVLRAVKAAVDERLRLYPNPTSSALREKLAKFHRCKPENIIVGNGSDELLALAVRAFVEPSGGGKRVSACTVQYFTPSYSLYPVLAETHGARTNAVGLAEDFALPAVAALKKGRAWDFAAALTFVTTPNAPSGRGYSTLCAHVLEGLFALLPAHRLLRRAPGDHRCARQGARQLQRQWPWPGGRARDAR